MKKWIWINLFVFFLKYFLRRGRSYAFLSNDKPTALLLSLSKSFLRSNLLILAWFSSISRKAWECSAVVGLFVWQLWPCWFGLTTSSKRTPNSTDSNQLVSPASRDTLESRPASSHEAAHCCGLGLMSAKLHARIWWFKAVGKRLSATKNGTRTSFTGRHMLFRVTEMKPSRCFGVREVFNSPLYAF